MSIVNKITKLIAGVEKSRDASPDSDVREQLREECFSEVDLFISERYLQCSECDKLKEEFKLFSFTVKDMTPACGECGCSLWLKIPIENESCPLGKWQ